MSFGCPPDLESFREPLLGWIGDRTNGALVKDDMTMIFSNGMGWEHVSVSLPYRTPTWAEMDEVKRKFWPPGATVVQYHPPEDEHVNIHPYCLHLWRPIEVDLPRPPGLMVGPKI